MVDGAIGEVLYQDKNAMNILKRVQQRATKMIKVLKELFYEETKKEPELFSLE